MALLGEQTTGQRACCCKDTEESTQYSILVLLSTAYELLQERESQQCDKAHGIGTYHTERRELVLLIVVSGHHAQQ